MAQAAGTEASAMAIASQAAGLEDRGARADAERDERRDPAHRAAAIGAPARQHLGQQETGRQRR